MQAVPKLLVLPIPHESIVKQRFTPFVTFMKSVDRIGKQAYNSVIITFSGYDDITDELWEIPEVRKYVAQIFNRYPYILYYMNKETETYEYMLACMAVEINSLHIGEPKKTTYEYMAEGIAVPPRFQSHLTFADGFIEKIKERTMRHALAIGDAEHGVEVLDYMWKNWRL